MNSNIIICVCCLLLENSNLNICVSPASRSCHTSYKRPNILCWQSDRNCILFCFLCVFSLRKQTLFLACTHTKSLKTTISPGGGDAGGKRLPIANFFFIQHGHVQTRLFTNHGCSLFLLCLYICECYYLPSAPLITPDRSKHTQSTQSNRGNDGRMRAAHDK